MKKQIILLALICLCFKIGKTQNSVKVFEPLIPITHPNLYVQNEYNPYLMQKNVYTFMDGLGRVTSQTNSHSGINIDNNVVPSYAVSDYDNNMGTDALLKKKNYLPCSRYSNQVPNNDGSIENLRNYFWQNLHPEENGYYYTETQTERSPLARVEKALKPGQPWVGSNVGISTQYEYNNATELIKIWNINFAIGDIPTSTQNYATGQLAKQIVSDEKGKKLITYTDNEGKIILKKVQEKEVATGLEENGYNGWLCTFYVYDDLNQIRCEITPKAVKYLQINNWAFTNPLVFNDLCFWNNYDARARLIVKHSPNSGETYMIYDNRDRPVLIQDQNQRSLASPQWSFITYDKLDRAVAAGLLQNNSTREVLQTYVNGLNNNEITVSLYVGNTENVILHNPVISGCNTCSNIVTNTINYYDGYNYSGAKNFNTNYSFVPHTLPNDFVPIFESLNITKRIQNFSTGSKVRVVKNTADDANPTASQYLTQTTYYSEQGKDIQSLADNAKGGVDYITNQYDFAGQVFGTCQNNTVPGTGITNYQTITKYSYDKLRRLQYTAIQLGTQPLKRIASYSYNMLGQVSLVKLDPDYNNNNGIETLTHSYNIQGWLNGVNKNYALSTQNSQQLQNYFGYYLGYDNRDNVFASAQTNGSITGVIWKTQGDNSPRKYNYEYDNANRFIKAAFSQKEEPAQTTWSNAKMDFTVSDILYDENGNLLQKFVKGILPGKQSPVFIDKLSYGYLKNDGIQSYSNQLKTVLDITTDLTATTNGQVGDFKNENFGTASASDYEYDGNGNLVKDNNKKIRTGTGAGILYNFLNRPLKITVEGKSITEYTYDATGGKISQKITNLLNNTSKTIWYMGSYLFEEQNTMLTLKEIYHPEGRIKVFAPTSNPRVTKGGSFTLFGNVQGVYEYFVKDNLQNTRVILTEETHSEYHNASMETAAASYEEQMFGQVNANGSPAGNNEVINTRILKDPQAAGWSSNNSQMVSKLSKYGYQVGPNALLKVMAGDNIGTKVDYYYDQPTNNPVGSTLISSLINNFVNSINVAATTINVHGASSTIGSNLQNTSGSGSLQDFIQTQNINGSSTPQAYLSIIFFDENFNFVSLGSTSKRVTTSGNGQSIPLQVGQAPKNGYVFVYISNESVTPVFFDNLELYHTRGRLVEENSYYPYGLKIKALSAKAFDALPNPYTYQGDYAELNEESGYNEFELRDYDAQIGRFLQADPYEEFASGYVGMGNDPVNNVDPSGGSVLSSITGVSNILFNTAVTTIVGAGIGGVIGIFNGDENAWKKGAGIGLGVGILGSVNWNIGYGASELGWNGGGLNFSSINTARSLFASRIVNDLSFVSGLILRINSTTGMLEYQTYRNWLGIKRPMRANHRSYSRKALRIVKSMIDNANVINVANSDWGLIVDSRGNPVGPHVPFAGDVNINMDNVFSNRFNGTAVGWNVDIETFSDAMVIIHEYGHTLNGGSRPDLINGKDNGSGGFNERPRKLNKIRRQMSRQMSTSWGKRAGYFVTPISGGQWVIPFNRAARRWLRKFGTRPPLTSKYKFIVWTP
jgi:RHS repeat-associated protein